MNAIRSTIAVIGLAGLLTACNSLTSVPAGDGSVSVIEPDVGGAIPQVISDWCDLRGAGTVDEYKIGVANHILRTNLGSTFEGRLPPMLPAVVVLRISVDSTGTVTDINVQRSRNATASRIAVASIQKSGRFPIPCSLITDQNPILSFSETFLFNDQYQFQLRSVAGPQ